MNTIHLTKDYHFTVEQPDEGFHYELILTEENNQVTLHRIDSEFEREDYICAQGVLPVLKELVSETKRYYSRGCYELGGMYENALNTLVYKLFSYGEVRHLLQAYEINFIVDLMEILLAKGKLDYLGDVL